MREKIQSFGGFLAGMIIPNIGAFIAWGLITALFIPTGWIPNENFASSSAPMITYLLPILIGYTGGYTGLWCSRWGRRCGRDHGRHRRRGNPHVPGRHDHGSAWWLVYQENR